jgi:hypothetical protein
MCCVGAGEGDEAAGGEECVCGAGWWGSVFAGAIVTFVSGTG